LTIASGNNLGWRALCAGKVEETDHFSDGCCGGSSRESIVSKCSAVCPADLVRKSELRYCLIWWKMTYTLDPDSITAIATLKSRGNSRSKCSLNRSVKSLLDYWWLHLPNFHSQ
jgi:hypothetical protein